MIENPKIGDPVYFMDGKKIRFGCIKGVHENFCEVEVWFNGDIAHYLLEYEDMWSKKEELLKDVAEMIKDLIETRARFKHLRQ